MKKAAGKVPAATPGQPWGDKHANDVKSVLSWLESLGSKRVREDMSKRFGIHTDKAWGLMMRDMQKVAKSIGTDHQLAQQLWKSGWYEARMVATMIADPKQVTPKEMDSWCKDFDNWAICDTACFKLWDQVPHAWEKVPLWAKSEQEFIKRAAFALLACLSLHRNDADPKKLRKFLPLVKKAASDERDFVKKGVSWALRGMANTSTEMHEAAILLAEELAASKDITARWVGKDVLRDIQRPMIAKRAEKRDTKRAARKRP
ncbi:MAG: DNA alkylation repair protein [Flavobacteriales bacterium]|nr:DNA alkylation repair protein [Flavobacteriales bacterium]